MNKYLDPVFKGIFETALDAIITIDEKGKIDNFNPTATKLFGYQPDEVAGRNVSMLMPEPYAHEHDGYLSHYASTNERHIIGSGREVLGKHKNGETFPIHLSVSEAKVDGKTIFIGFVRDISKFKDMETKLGLTETQAEAILNTAIDGIATINRTGIIQSANNAMTTLFLYEQEELIGKPVTMLMPEPYASEHDMYLSKYLETNEKHVIGIGRMVEALRKDGSVFPMFLSVSEFKLDGEIFFAGIIRNLTSEMEKENSLSIQANKLQMLNKELEGFAYSVSHDLKAPLRHIIGYLEMLGRKISNNTDKDVERYISIISKEAHRLDEMIQLLLSFSRLGRVALKIKSVSFDAVIQKVVDAYEPDTINRDITWDIKPLPKVDCDEDMFYLVWENLISNALKFTAKTSKTKIKIDCEDDKLNYKFSISDNGVGFDQQYVDKLFKVFQRLHAGTDFNGTGIGLCNIKKIIDKHSGNVWIEGEVDKGATVYFTIPKNIKKG
ncbi:MAG: PAS domain S-box protein [Legionellaceae bacterium]|nr:PAS domain S-box protein [Legionellaceae bacterium]